MRERLVRLYSFLTKHPKLCYAALLSAVGATMFGSFFTDGFILDGNWDRRDQIFPFHLIAQQSFHAGVWPQWNPYIFCGTSFLFSTANLSFYPLLWGLYLLPASLLPAGLTCVVILHFFLAGWFAYLLIVQAGGNIPTAMTFGLSFVLSSSLVMNAATEATYYGLCLLPAALYLLASFRKRSVTLNVGLLAIVYSLVIVSGVANIFIYVSAVCLAYGAYPLAIDWRNREARIMLASNLGAYALALGVTAVKLLPFFYDARYYLSSKASFDSFLQTGWTPYEALLRLFMPHFFGDKTYPTTINVLIENWLGSKVPGVMNNYEAFIAYTGVPAAFLALYALLFLWNKSTGFWKIALIGTILTVCGGPLAYVHYVATGSSNIHFGRLAMLIPLYVAVLAAQAWLSATSSARHLRDLTLFVLVVGSLIYCASWLIDQRIAGLIGSTAVEKWVFPAKAQTHFLTVAGAFIAILVAAQLARDFLKQGVLNFMLLALVLGDLLVTSHTDKNFSRPFLAPVQDFLVPAAGESLPPEITKDKKFRVLSVDPSTHGCKTVHLPAYNMSGLDQAAPRFITELYWYPRVPNRMDGRSVTPGNQETAERVFQLTSTSLILAPDGVFQVPNALPRWSLLSDYRVIEDPEMQKSEVLGAAFDPQRSVILEKAPDLPMTSEAVSGMINLIGETANEIAFEVETRNNAIFLLTNSFYPGWSVTINDQPAEIIKANAAFQSVAVPAGRSTVRFSFSHERWKLGVSISLLSICVVGSLLAVAVVRSSQADRGETKLFRYT
jgi:hypothetical protein